MAIFSAWVKDKETKQQLRIDKEYPTKAKFIYDLKANGYAVNPDKVKISKVFDYILDNTNCTPEEWKYINKIPAYNESISDIINTGIQKTFERQEANFYKKYPKN